MLGKRIMWFYDMPRYIIQNVHFSTTEKKGCESCKERIKYDPGAEGKKKSSQ